MKKDKSNTKEKSGIRGLPLRIHFSVPIFNVGVSIYVITEDEAARSLLIDHDCEDEWMENDTACTTNLVHKSYGIGVIFRKDKITSPIISHEVQHIREAIWDHIGCVINHASREAETYLDQFLTEKIIKLLLKNGINVTVT